MDNIGSQNRNIKIGALPRTPKFTALVFQAYAKENGAGQPHSAYAMQNPINRSGCASAEPYPVYEQKQK